MVNGEISLYDFLQTSSDILIHPLMDSFQTQCEIFIERSRQASGAVDLALFSQGQFEHVLKKRIMGHLRLGYHLDHCVSDLFDAGFEPINVRGFADKVTYFLTYLRQAEVAQFPIEMQYGFNQQFCTISFSVSVSHFVKEYLYTAAHKKFDLTDPLSRLIAEAKDLAHIVEIIYIDSSKKLVINGSWLKQKVNHNLMFVMQAISAAKLLPTIKSSGNHSLKSWNHENLDQLEQKKLDNNHIQVLENETTEIKKSNDQLAASFVASFSGAGFGEDDLQVIKSTINEVAKDHMQMIQAAPKNKDENAVLIFQSLKDRLKNVDEHKLQTMVNKTLDNYIEKQRQELEKKQSQQGPDEFSHMHETIKQKDDEIDGLKRKIKTLFFELKALQATEKVRNEIAADSSVDLDMDSEKIKELESEIAKRDRMIEELKKQDNLSMESREQIADLLVKLGDSAKERHLLELNLKRISFHSAKKEAHLLQEIKGREKLLSAKESMIESFKENLARLNEEKEKNIGNLNNRIAVLNSELSKFKALNPVSKIENLENEKMKLNELLKKLNLQLNKLTNENEALKNKSTDIQNQAKIIEKEHELAIKNVEIEKLKTSLRVFEEKYVQMEQSLPDQTSSNNPTEIASQEELTSLKELVSDKEDIISALEDKLMELEKERLQASSPVISPDAETKQMNLKLDKLEKDKQKLMEEVRNKTKESAEAVVLSKKLKTEVTALQNRLKLLEQENQRLKSKNASSQSGKKAS